MAICAFSQWKSATNQTMNDSEFMRHSDAIFNYIETQLEENSDAFDSQISGNVLSIEHEDGDEVIVNRHLATQELWIAAKSGGFHFTHQKNHWLSTRDDSEFFAVLSEVLSIAAQEKIDIPPFQAA